MHRHCLKRYTVHHRTTYRCGHCGQRTAGERTPQTSSRRDEQEAPGIVGCDGLSGRCEGAEARLAPCERPRVGADALCGCVCDFELLRNLPTFECQNPNTHSCDVKLILTRTVEQYFWAEDRAVALYDGDSWRELRSAVAAPPTPEGLRGEISIHCKPG